MARAENGFSIAVQHSGPSFNLYMTLGAQKRRKSSGILAVRNFTGNF